MTNIFVSLLLIALASSGCAQTRVDWIITAGEAVTMDPARPVISDAAVAVAGERIAAIGSRPKIEKTYSAARTLRRPRAIVMPGLVNAHTHAPMSLMRGIADDLALQDWLEKFIFPAEAKSVSAGFVRDGTRLAVIEMLLSGTTTYADMYYFEEVVAEETRKAGMRGVLGQTVIRFPAPDAKTPEDALKSSEAFIRKFKGDALITPAVAPHAIYTNSDSTLRAARKLANEHGVPLLIHLSETRKENDDARAARGMSPTAALDALGILSGRTLAAHGVWLDEADMEILKKRGAGIAHCPSSNMKLASGAANVTRWLALGLRAGLGTDGPAGSNNDLNLFEEMDLAAKLAKVMTGDPRALAANQALALATTGGARALGLEKEIGSLEVGKRADLILVAMDSPHATPGYNPMSQLVFAAKGSDVTDVMVNGRLVVKQRRALTLDQAAVLNAARAWSARIGKTVEPARD
jgi:5-methylthioadenosine/S-adenosylhomocysteine deaminase